MDAGEDDLSVAFVCKNFGLVDDFGRRQAAARPPGEGDDAVGAETLAAVLDTQVGAAAVAEATDRQAADFLGQAMVAEKHLGRIVLAPAKAWLTS